MRADIRAGADQPYPQAMVMVWSMLPFEHGRLEVEGLPGGGVLSTH